MMYWTQTLNCLDLIYIDPKKHKLYFEGLVVTVVLMILIASWFWPCGSDCLLG